jgi:molybdopterin molybdotransferase
MVRTVEEHAAAIATLVSAALARRGSHEVGVRPARLSSSTDGHRHRVLAEAVTSPVDLPPFDNSQMDGYAVRAVDLADGETALRVAARIPAGSWPVPLEPGWAAPIMTGAAIPFGADAVVPIERARPDAFLPEPVTEGATVVLPGPVEDGLFVRRRGSDLVEGATLFEAGTRLGAAQWGSLAAAGVERVRLVDRPRILLISTGEELTEPGAALAPGRIYDANGPSLAVALSGTGAEVVSLRVPDDASALLAAVAEGIREHGIDLVVTMGGVSAGAYEVVRDAFEPRGVTFGSVAMQPGGPQGWGVLDLDGSSVPVVCLPGNPVSVLVSFEAFLRVPLLRAAGRTVRRDETAILAEGADSPAGKHQMRRGRRDDDGRIRLVGGPSSHLLHAYALADVLVHIPLGVSRVEAGDEVVVWALDD